jgi:hypothetical protein
MIYTLCGSTKFKKEFEEINLDLTLQGHVVITVAAFGHADNKKFTLEQKTLLDRIHIQKIDIADAIYVIDVGGYIGESTTREIAHAIATGKRIYFYSQQGTN